jgi:hypothetical protein
MSFWEATETYSPTAIESAPAKRAARAAIRTWPCEFD